MDRTRRWTNVEDQTGYWGPAAELEATRVSGEAAASALAGSVSLSGDLIATAMRERQNAIGAYTNLVASMTKVLAAVDGQVYQYASDVYAELKFSEMQASLFDESRTAVDATFAQMAGSALKKIDSISERLGSDDNEAVCHAMTTCRRLIDAVADHVFPARDDEYDMNGQSLSVKQNNVLNRINAFIHSSGVVGGRANRLHRGLSDIYERVSKSVHTDVGGHEARYVFLSTYVFLGEVLTLPGAS